MVNVHFLLLLGGTRLLLYGLGVISDRRRFDGLSGADARALTSASPQALK